MKSVAKKIDKEFLSEKTCPATFLWSAALKKKEVTVFHTKNQVLSANKPW
jgi:hypothetical protein